MRRASTLWLFALVLACLPAWGTEIRVGNIVTIPPQEVIDDDLVVLAQDVLVEGTVNGNLIAAGQTVRVPGRVLGTVIGAGRTVDVAGEVRGSAAVAGQNVILAGDVGRNAAAAGNTVIVSSGADVGKDLHAAGQSVNLDGRVGRDVDTAGQTVNLGGRIGRAARVYADNALLRGAVGHEVRFEGKSLSFQSGAHVAGDVISRSPQAPVIAQGAKVDGVVRRLEPRAPKVPKKRSPHVPAFIFFLVVFVNGVIGLAAAPRLFVAGANAIPVRPWWNLLIGIVVLVVVPVVALIVCFTVIGLPVGLLALALWGLAMLLSGVPVGTFIGKALLGSLRAGRPVSAYWALLVGLLILMVVGFIPYLGTLTKLLTVLFGVGVLARAAKGLIVEMRASVG